MRTGLYDLSAMLQVSVNFSDQIHKLKVVNLNVNIKVSAAKCLALLVISHSYRWGRQNRHLLLCICFTRVTRI